MLDKFFLNTVTINHIFVVTMLSMTELGVFTPGVGDVEMHVRAAGAKQLFSELYPMEKVLRVRALRVSMEK